MSTKIEWADHTINPTVGCMKCSPGCANCYAERFAARLVRNPQTAAKYAGVVDEHGHWTGKISEPDYSVFERLPKTPKRVFLGSMTDLFFQGVNDYGRKALRTNDGKLYEFAPNTMHVRIARLLVQIGRYPQHTFMMLTKRPEAMGEALDLLLKRPLLNLWIGVTVCNQEEADEKIPVLLSIPAAKRFVSIEPMLGAIELREHFLREHCLVCKGTDRDYTGCHSQTEGHFCCNDGCDCTAYPWGTHWMRGLDWVICGGETGHNARPMHPEWARSLRDQCQGAGVPFFFKGWGEWVTENQSPEDIVLPGSAIVPHGWVGKKYEDSLYKVGKKRAGRLLDGVEYSEFPGV